MLEHGLPAGDYLPDTPSPFPECFAYNTLSRGPCQQWPRLRKHVFLSEEPFQLRCLSMVNEPFATGVTRCRWSQRNRFKWDTILSETERSSGFRKAFVISNSPIEGNMQSISYVNSHFLSQSGQLFTCCHLISLVATKSYQQSRQLKPHHSETSTSGNDAYDKFLCR